MMVFCILSGIPQASQIWFFVQPHEEYFNFWATRWFKIIQFHIQGGCPYTGASFLLPEALVVDVTKCLNFLVILKKFCKFPQCCVSDYDQRGKVIQYAITCHCRVLWPYFLEVYVKHFDLRALLTMVCSLKELTQQSLFFHSLLCVWHTS